MEFFFIAVILIGLCSFLISRGSVVHFRKKNKDEDWAFIIGIGTFLGSFIVISIVTFCILVSKYGFFER